jgi:hypothetical protein
VSDEDCRFCDFGPICGGAIEAGIRSEKKLAAATDPALVGFRELNEGSTE